MASELSKFIDDELLREGNTGERSQLLNGGTFNVEKPSQRQSRSNIFSKRNIALIVISTVVVGVLGIAVLRKAKTTSNIHGSKYGISAGPNEVPAAAPDAVFPVLGPGPEPAPAPAPALGLVPGPAPATSDSPIGSPSDGPYPAPSPDLGPDQPELAPAPAPGANGPAPKLLKPRKLIGRKRFLGRL